MAEVGGTKQEIEKLEAELAKYRATMQRFAETVNDLNNLLTAMRGHAQMAYEDSNEKHVQELIRVVLTSTARAQKIIRDSVGLEGVASEVARRLSAAARPRDARILVVDDEQLILSLMHELLTKSGYQVVTVMDEEDALRQCRAKPFDLVFLDVRLKSGDGVNLFRQIRGLWPAVPVVFLSGDPNIEGIWRKCREEGADGFIKKPFDITEIEHVVNRLLSLPT